MIHFKQTISTIAIIILIHIPLYSQNSVITESSQNVPKWEVHVALGVPTDNDSSDDYLIKRDQYVLSYNTEKSVANWVCWNLNLNWFGRVKRSGSFKTDPLLPEGAYKVKSKDYKYSGYDQGHMVMSQERTRNVTDNKSTFYLTNILPQTPDLNQRLWRGLEDYCNELCKDENKELYIIAGGVFHNNNKIKDKISIPDSCFKIVIILERNEGLDEVAENTQVIAVMMPNENDIGDLNWRHYTTSVRRIEWSTKYDFLSNVDKSIQDVIENKIYKEE
jgi:endonuclease G, mitochondrial